MNCADVWDAQATTRQDAMWAVWSQPDWWASIPRSLDQILGALAPVLTDGDGMGPWLVEIGCGVGRLTLPVAHICADVDATVTGLDVSPRMVDHARARAAGRHMDNVDFRTTDGRTLPLPDSQVDAVWSTLVFQHVDDDVMYGYLAETVRVLRPGGLMRFQTVDGRHAVGLDHRRPRVQVERMMAAVGLELVTVEEDPVQPEWSWFTGAAP